MKKFLGFSVISAFIVSITTALFGTSVAFAAVTTLEFVDPVPETFTAGADSPEMTLAYDPVTEDQYLKVKLAIYDAAGEETGSGSAANFNSMPNCFVTTGSDIIGCSNGGFIELRDGFSGNLTLHLSEGAFTLPDTAGDYTIKIEMYSDGNTRVDAETTTVPFDVVAGSDNSGGDNEGNSGDNGGDGGNNNGGTPNHDTFTVAQSSTTRNSSASFSTLAVGANVPGFTSSYSGFSGGNVVDRINFFLGDVYSADATFWEIPGSTSQTGGALASWDPAGNDCGLSAIRIGGVAQGASSGITCQKVHQVDPQTQNDQYWISMQFANPITDSVSYDVKAGTFVVTQSGNFNFFTTLFNTTGSSPAWVNITQAFDAAENNATPENSAVSFGFTVSPGESIFGKDVTIAASDLALSTDYSVVLRSTPQILASGRTVSSSFNTSVTIPDNLEAGWHSITFNATRSDGAAISEVVYFKINANGILLETTTTQPAELAYTPAPPVQYWFWAMLILALGLGAYVYGREFSPEFMRVMSLVRNENGELEFVKRRIKSEDF